MHSQHTNVTLLSSQFFFLPAIAIQASSSVAADLKIGTQKTFINASRFPIQSALPHILKIRIGTAITNITHIIILLTKIEAFMHSEIHRHCQISSSKMRSSRECSPEVKMICKNQKLNLAGCQGVSELFSHFTCAMHTPGC